MKYIKQIQCYSIDYQYEPLFEDFFPNVVSEVIKFPTVVTCTEYNKNLEQSYELFKPLYEEISSIIPLWNWLQYQNNGRVTIHILRMLYCVLIDPDYLKMSPRDQNILKWATLLHDIAKRSSGTAAPKKKDTAHPYYSGAETLRILAKIYYTKEKCEHCHIRIKNLMQLIRDGIIMDRFVQLDKLEGILYMAESIFG